ncbi:PAX3- and PAX7-binding protein 1 isoform X2 [Pieris brassicae]|uniref:PAX3- and PAX7-binding protein 1 isoform X2 n=1 Tax=Pieris brassicae TaxID=7116 RepID=UPI001E65EA4A|nr:PAX3- and PAX7-binding protein 1 isoform X2 [Pieris brassicae]
MSLFRKPKKIQRRVFCAEDQDDSDPEPPPPPTISHKKENKTAKGKTLLSFADEEDEGEVFKVKKSSQSKRLAKRREKEKRSQPDDDVHKVENNGIEENQADDKDITKKKKKVSLEGMILSGREALAADGAGDISDESGNEDEDSRGFHQFRAETVRAALAGAGHIPDAALIHAARKTRQQARELGDYIPIKSDTPSGSRLIHEDDDDDEEEGRIQVRGLELPSDKPKRGTATLSDEELNSEAEEWEEQQMQKAVPSIVDITGESDLNPFAVAPPPARLEAPQHLRALGTPAGPPPTTAQELVLALQKRLSELQTDRQETINKRQTCQERLLNSARVRESRSARCQDLDAAYKRAQAVRGYLTDLIECLDEKMPQLEALEARALMFHKRRCDFLIERRRADVRDQAQDVLALVARPGSIKPPDSEEKRRRCAEREGRRRARRLKREAASTSHLHRDGDSSDDELPPKEGLHVQHETDAIRQLSSSLFADALPAWRSIRGICTKMARWRRKHSTLYSDAYIADCLPRLLAPYVRHQLIMWNPLADVDNEDYEKMDWYKCLMMYGVRSEKLSDDSESSEEDVTPQLSEGTVRDDVDLMLVPTILDKVVLPKIAEIVENAWDPMSVRACIRLRNILVRAATLPVRSSLEKLSAAVNSRLASSLAADVFLPPAPQLADNAGGQFWKRCLGAGVRLLRASLCLCAPPDILSGDHLALSLIETLCCAAGAAPGPQMSAAAAALANTLPRTGPLRTTALNRLAKLAHLALTRLQTDNPLHLHWNKQERYWLKQKHWNKILSRQINQ